MAANRMVFENVIVSTYEDHASAGIASQENRMTQAMATMKKVNANAINAMEGYWKSGASKISSAMDRIASAGRSAAKTIGDAFKRHSNESGNALGDLKKKSDSAAGGIGAMWKTVIGGIVAAMGVNQLKQGFRTLTEFAKTHNTEVTASIVKMDNALNSFLTGLVNSPIFKSLVDKITEALNFGAVLLQNQAAWDALIEYLKAKWDLFVFGAHKDFLSMFNPFAAEDSFDMSDPKTVERIFNVRAALAELNKQVTAGMKNLKKSSEIQPAGEAKPIDQNMIVSRDAPKQLGRVAIPIAPTKDLISPLKQSIPYVRTFSDELQNAMVMLNEGLPTAAEQMANSVATGFELATQVVSGFFEQLVQGAIAGHLNMKKVLKGMLGMILSTIGAEAIARGSVMMLSAFASFPAVNGVMLAKGAALVALGGSLKGAGAALSAGASGGGAATEKPQTQRDFGSRNEPKDQKQVIQNNYFQILRPESIPKALLNDLSYSLKQQIDKQNSLGR